MEPPDLSTTWIGVGFHRSFTADKALAAEVDRLTTATRRRFGTT
jgi:hypothetical protein